MRTIRCQRCRRMFDFEGMPPSCCPECSAEEEKEYRIVREYVKEHRGATLQEVSRILNVPHHKIIQYLREERLEIVNSSASFLRCHICGKVINTGTRCGECKKRHGYEVFSGIQQPADDTPRKYSDFGLKKPSK